MRTFLPILALTVLSLSTRAAARTPANTRYTAFDLAAGKLTVTSIPNVEAVGDQLAARHCTSQIVGGGLTIDRTGDPDCRSIFDTRQPQDLRLDLVVHPPTNPPLVVAFNLLFETGLYDLAHADYDAANHQVDFRNDKLAGWLAFHSKQTGRWSKLDVAKGLATLPSSDGITPDTMMYFKTSYSEDVVAVNWSAKRAPGKPPSPEDFETTCKAAIARAGNYAWRSYVDTVNPTASLEFIPVPSATDIPRLIVEPNSFGLIVARHAEALIVTFDSGPGTLTLPSIYTGLGQAGTIGGPATAETQAPPQPKYVCTTHQVPPHAPGPFQVKLKVVDPNKGTNNTVSERNLDVIVLQRYAGAFRAGVAGIFGAPDQKFEARTSPASSQPEIVRTGYTPVELVFGYSVYFSGIHGPGRSYFTKQGDATQDSHWGGYLGFGAVSVTSISVDYLKSLHLGLEYEVSPYFAIAVTGVIRRVDGLAAGAHIGGSASSVPTESGYAPGIAVVLNISPSFFKFPTQITK